MKIITNDCVDCQIHCLGSSCPLRNMPHYLCDDCGEEAQLYYFDDEELCIDCIERRLEKVN